MLKEMEMDKHLTCQMCGTKAVEAFGNPPQPICRVCGATLSPNNMAALSKRKLRIFGAANDHLLAASSYLNELKSGEYTEAIYQLSVMIDEASSLCNTLLNESYVEVLNAKESEK
jgi:hypothetical protein